jgi:hypothetical protein
LKPKAERSIAHPKDICLYGRQEEGTAIGVTSIAPHPLLCPSQSAIGKCQYRVVSAAGAAAAMAGVSKADKEKQALWRSVAVTYG